MTVRATETQGMFLSIALHIAVAAGAWVTVPFLSRDMPEEAPIIVDLVPIDEVTAAPPRPVPVPEQKPEPKPEAKPEPPKPVEAEKPNPDQMPPAPEEKPTPPPPKEVVEAPPPPKTPPPPPKPKPKAKPKTDEWDLVKNLVKNLEKQETSEQQKEEQVAAAATNDTKVIAPMIADRATMTERDAIRRHIEGCWRIDPGKEGIENLSVEINVWINPDGSVQQAQIAATDVSRYLSDSTFRTFANSARNAVLSCGNIPISQQNYETFKEISFNFSPQGRIN